MVFRNVQKLKIILIVFHLWTIGNGKAHSDKNILKFVQHSCQRVLSAHRMPFSGHGDVDFFLLDFVFHFLICNITFSLFDQFFQPGSDVIRQLADHRPFLR